MFTIHHYLVDGPLEYKYLISFLAFRLCNIKLGKRHYLAASYDR